MAPSNDGSDTDSHVTTISGGEKSNLSHGPSDSFDVHSQGSTFPDGVSMISSKAAHPEHSVLTALRFCNEFWKVIVIICQACVIGGLALLEYFLRFTDIFPLRETVFNCADLSIQVGYENYTYHEFAFGEYISEEWVYLFSWFGPLSVMIALEILYSLFHYKERGCRVSKHLKLPLAIRRLCKFNGTFFYGIVATLLVTEAGKLFTAKPRPFFLEVCQPIDHLCIEANSTICSQNNTLLLRDARTSFPSLPSAASSYASVFTSMYCHAMFGHQQQYLPVFQSLGAMTFLTVAFLAGLVEVSVRRSHWEDVLAGALIGTSIAIYLTVYILKMFEDTLPRPPKKVYDTQWVQVDEPQVPESVFEFEEDPDSLPLAFPRYDAGECFHRPTSWQTSFQSDLNRSLNMFKKFREPWGPAAPKLEFVFEGNIDKQFEVDLENEKKSSFNKNGILLAKPVTTPPPPPPPPPPVFSKANPSPKGNPFKVKLKTTTSKPAFQTGKAIHSNGMRSSPAPVLKQSSRNIQENQERVSNHKQFAMDKT